VVLQGANFLGASAVSFSGILASFFPVTNNTLLVATVPAGVTSGNVTVTTPGGEATSPMRYYVAAAIHSFNPTSGLPGDTVQVQGLNFLDATAVRFGGSNALFNVVNNTALTATVPPNAATGPISVVTPAGTAVSAQNFAVNYQNDVRVAADGSPTNLTVFETVLYTFAIANLGPHPANNVIFSNAFPAGMLLKATGQNAGIWVTNLGTVEVSSTRYLQFELTPTQAGILTNYSRVTSDYTDPYLTNNVAEIVTTVYPLPKLTITRPASKLVKVAWPAMLTNYTLQAISPLTADPEGWTNVPAQAVLEGENQSITEPSTLPSKLYRLKK
jgi:uncharacterized repeat protein (TIGR01451 family)